MQSPNVFQIPRNFIYRGEGNSSVVLSLPESRQILRLHKIKESKSLLDWFVHWLMHLFNWECKDEIVQERKNLRFYSVVMRSLFNRSFVCPAQQVFVSRKEIRELDEFLYDLRPENRREKRLQHGRATIFEDYTFMPKNLSVRSVGNTYAIEIKPKQGWVPLCQEKLAKCTYCLNQYLKLQKGEIKTLSAYCPYDLFSGESLRMTKAIKALTQNPQNNFRVFRNGVCVYRENISADLFYGVVREWFGVENNQDILLRKFCDVIRTALVTKHKNHPLKDHICTTPSTKNCPQLYSYAKHDSDLLKKAAIKCETDINETRLPKGCVLREILEVQQLDRLGCHLYAKYKPDGADNWGYIDRLVEKVLSDQSKCAKCALGGIVEACEKEGVSRVMFFVPYLVAAVVRDCSIMLTFRKIDCDTKLEAKEIHSVVMIGDERFLVSVGILDLYPKPMSTIKKHVKRSEDIIRAYKNM